MFHEAKPVESDKYRDSISLVDKPTGKRAFVYPKKPIGKLYTLRSLFSYLLLLIFFITPFINFNGHPLLLLNILDRKFILFGIPFWPQDLPLFALLMVTFVVFIIVFTVLFGRLWCGWACPQTVFMEMFFRKIEYWIEGDYKQQMKLDNSSGTLEKYAKKTLKHILFFFLSVVIANTFLAYLIGINEVSKLVTDGPKAHLGQFVALIIFSGVFYLVFSNIREIVCIVICPYGRLQGLMLDKNSIVVAYDYKRGEPRGHLKKNSDNIFGDCIDCKRCVHVCPTGIDIRNGTQLECINCTACIDECNDVMKHIKRPENLIRYASQNQIANGSSKRITKRSIAYSVILVLLISILSYLLITRPEIHTVILRTPGMLYQQQNNGYISNMYNFELVNKTFDEHGIEMEVIYPKNAVLKMIDRDHSKLTLNEDDILKGSFFVLIPSDDIIENNSKVKIRIREHDKEIKIIETNFVGPVKQ